MPLRRLSGPIDRRADPPKALVLVTLGLVVASRFLALAASPGEIDEAVFAGAVTRFDLFDLSPQAPGFPVWILIGRALLPFCVTPFNALATASTALSAVGLVSLYVWGRRAVGGWAALSGVLVAAALPVVWINGGRAFSDTSGTALCLLAAALLAVTDERRSPNQTRWREFVAARRSRLLALGAGLAAAAGWGVRPHLLLAFGPLFLVVALRLISRVSRRDAAVSFVGALAAGVFAWVAWLGAQAGGLSGLKATLVERSAFRSYAMAVGSVGGFFDSFLFRDFLTVPRAFLFWGVAAAGAAFLLNRRRRGVRDLALVVTPLFLSLWFLHNRSMSRYSVPFAMIAALVFGAGLEAIFRRRVLAFLVAVGVAAGVAAEAYPAVRTSATRDTPPIAAIRHLERYLHAGRETVVADDVFHAFLRTERWEGRFWGWAYGDSEFVSAPLPTNKRIVRLADFTGDVGAPDRIDPLWKSWFLGGRVFERLGNSRLLAVAVRDPAPPLFGPGFGVKEQRPGAPAFRWAGPAARLLVPGLEGPPVAVLLGERDTNAGETTLTVTEEATREVVLSRKIPPGPFDLAIVPRTLYGPLPGPTWFVLSCDRPMELPPLAGAMRPRLGCFRIREATFSYPPEEIWERNARGYLLDVGSAADARADLAGFHARERIEKEGFDFRWTAGEASALFSPVRGFSPGQLIVRARPPSNDAVDVAVAVGGLPAGTLHVPPGGFSDLSLDLPEGVLDLFDGTAPVRIGLRSSVFVPKAAGAGDDPRPLGIAIDRISLEVSGLSRRPSRRR